MLYTDKFLVGFVKGHVKVRAGDETKPELKFIYRVKDHP
jgi:hypothetical protein